MFCCKLTSEFSAGRRLACIMAVVLLAGCAASRSEVVNPSAASNVARVSDLSSDQPEVRLVSAEQPVNGPAEALPIPPPVELAEQNSAAEVLGESAGQPLELPAAISLAFQRQPRLRVY